MWRRRPGSLSLAPPAVDFVAPRGIRLHDPGDRRGQAVRGGRRHHLAQRGRRDRAQPRPRAIIQNMDELPFVAPVYRRDLEIEDYFIGYLKHPYVSLLHRPRLPLEVHLLPVAADRRRPSLPHALARTRWSRRCAGSRRTFPQVQEFMFDDDTFTDDPCRASRRSPAAWASSA